MNFYVLCGLLLSLHYQGVRGQVSVLLVTRSHNQAFSVSPLQQSSLRSSPSSWPTGASPRPPSVPRPGSPPGPRSSRPTGPTRSLSGVWHTTSTAHWVRTFWSKYGNFWVFATGPGVATEWLQFAKGRVLLDKMKFSSLISKLLKSCKLQLALL